MPFEYTGHLAENELLGQLSKKKYKEKVGFPSFESEKVFREFIKNSYLPYKQALELVKLCQPHETSDPDPEFANDLHAKLAEKLNLEDFRSLNLFTAIGSHLDYHYGVDAFFEFKSESGRIIRITLDVTTNPKKDIAKADVLFYVPLDGIDRKQNRNEYMQKIEEVAKECFDAINFKLAH